MYPNAKDLKRWLNFSCVIGDSWSSKFPSKAWLDSVDTSIGKVFSRGLMYYMAYFVPEMHRSFMLNNLWDQ
jgi:hypothetical protein